MDMLDIRFSRLNAASVDYSHYWELLDADERTRAQHISIPLKRQHYVETHGRLRLILGAAVSSDPARLTIAKTAHGKPYLADYPHFAFNLSHTADLMAVALSRDCRLGIDIELCKSRTNLTALVEKCFGKAEAAHWHALPENEKVHAFYGYWTRKEAFVKAVGQGIHLGLQHCVIDPEDSGRMLNVPSSCGLAGDWSLRAIDLNPGICGAIAVDKSIGEIRVKSFDDVYFR